VFLEIILDGSRALGGNGGDLLAFVRRAPFSLNGGLCVDCTPVMVVVLGFCWLLVPCIAKKMLRMIGAKQKPLA
jgi:hypothetical protein